jgi:hypothetical protein
VTADASRWGRHRARTAVLAAVLAGLAALTACSAGKVTQTSRQQPPVAGVNANVGPIALRNVLIAYNGPEGYPVGSNAPLVVRIFNQGPTVVRLTGVAAPDMAERVVLVGTPTATPSPLESESPSATPTGTAEPGQSPSAEPTPTARSTAPAGRATFSIPIPPGSYVLLVPGEGAGFLQLVGLTKALQTGLWARVTFTFDDGRTTAELDVPVGVPNNPLPRPEPVQPAE